MLKVKSRDLHLLPVLERLIATRSVTASARDLNLTVPAASRALSRLRDVFQDELLVRAGRGMVLTTKAEALRPIVRDCLSRIDQLSEVSAFEDIRRVRARFTLHCDDVLAGAICSDLFKTANAQAPGVTIDVRTDAASTMEDLRTGAADLEIGGRRKFPPEAIVRSVGKDRLVGLVRRGHPLLEGEVSLERFLSYPHVMATVQKQYEETFLQELGKRNVSRDVHFVAPSFYAAANTISNSEMVMTTPSIIGSIIETQLNLVAFDIPIELPPINVSVAWHMRRQSDFAHAWLRDMVYGILGRMMRTPARG